MSFADCIAWWNKREAGPLASQVGRDELRERHYDLDIPNPTSGARPDHLPAVDLAKRILERAAETVQTARQLVDSLEDVRRSDDFRTLGNFVQLRKDFVTIDDATEYSLATVQLHARGIIPREKKQGNQI